MRTSGILLTWLAITLFITILLSSCKKCEPYRSNTQMPESSKGLIPNNSGDTLKFKDHSGRKYYLVCTSKEVLTNGFSHTGHNNPCDDTYASWEYLQADFNGNVEYDSGEKANLRVIFGKPRHDPTYISTSCNTNQSGSRFLLKFGSANAAQWLDGWIEEMNSPQFKNYLFRQQISLVGQLFQNVNIHSVSTPGTETICPPEKALQIGIDSVYYSVQHGLLRFTTVGGKKYQRVL